MQHYLYLTDECMNTIQSHAELPFKNNGIRLDSGMWKTPIDEESISRLNALSLKGEMISDTIIRLLSRVQ